ncbi:hypothetical protein [Hafnia paralvei]|uniref:hypothetical protein n=1 Tax=Hafnia paralvei TaxID=546367 RepID=UPI0010344440|nr:hypothetical protein [Hafnia paralvei]TBL61943.1 hypothetical protein EYY97_10405 [Hafnia paralvei]
MKPMPATLLAMMIGITTFNSLAQTISPASRVETTTELQQGLNSPTLTATGYKLTGTVDGAIAFKVSAKNNNNQKTNIAFYFLESPDGKSSHGIIKNGDSWINVALVPDVGSFDGSGRNMDAKDVALGETVTLAGVVLGNQQGKTPGTYKTYVEATSWVM